MKWDYRIIYQKINEDELYSVHEVYYDEEDRPVLYVKEPAKLLGGNIEQLREQWSLIAKSLEKPILEKQIFTNTFDGAYQKMGIGREVFNSYQENIMKSFDKKRKDRG